MVLKIYMVLNYSQMNNSHSPTLSNSHSSRELLLSNSCTKSRGFVLPRNTTKDNHIAFKLEKPYEKRVLRVSLGVQTPRNNSIKALRLRRRAFICFSLFAIPDETLALVFDIFKYSSFNRLYSKYNW